MGRPIHRCAFSQIHQLVDPGPATPNPLQCTRDDTAHDESALGLSRQTMGQIGDGSFFKAGKASAPSSRHHTLQSALRQLLVVPHQVVDGLPDRLAFRHRHLLDCMLEFKTRRLELFGQVRAVQQLERGHALTFQPIFQNTPDRLAR